MSVREAVGEDGSERLAFAVLGPVRVWSEGRAVKPGSPQQQAVLTQLLLRPGFGVSMHDLMWGVWGDGSPDGAVSHVRTYAWRLRRLLEPDPAAPRVLVSVGDGYRLDVPEGAVDAPRAAGLADGAAGARAAGDLTGAHRLVTSALELWHGEPLSKVPGPFAERERDRWNELRTALLEEKYEVALALGQYQAAIPELTVLAAEHPGRERLHGLLMRALHGTGRTPEALALFQQVRRRLVEEQGVEPGAELTSLHRRLYTSPQAPADDLGPRESVTAGSPPAPAGTATGGEAGPAGTFRPTVPAQLPRAVSDFVGRAAEIDTLRALLVGTDRDSLPLAAVSGMGGIGKTSLVLHVAHQVRDHYPDGQLYADLRGMERDPEAPGIVLGAFLEGLGYPLKLLPDTVEGRSRLLRTVLDGRRVLMVLDNAADAAQVRHLIPGAATCAVLVTSRGQLASLEGAVQLCLGRLLPEESISLVGSIIGRDRLGAEREAARALVGACGQLPLATRIVAARLAARPGWPLAVLTARLTDEARKVSELKVGDLAVEAAFDLSYRHLTPDQARAFRLIAVATAAELGLDAAGAILGTAEFDTEDLLEELVSASMLESPAPGRYRLHDLLRLFGRGRALVHDRAEADLAYENLLGYLLATACNAFERLVPGDPVAGTLASLGTRGTALADAAEARAWAAAHFELAVLALQSCAGPGAGAPAQGLLPAATDLLVALSPFVGDLRHEQLAPAALTVAAAAKGRGDLRSYGRAEWLSCSFALRAGRPSAAYAHARQAVEACRLAGDLVILRQALNDLGLIAVSLGDFAEAIVRYEEAIVLARELGHRSGEIATSLNCALAQARSGGTEAAMRTAEAMLEAGRALDDAAAVAYALYVQGIALSEAGRHEEAARRQTEALDACLRAGDGGREVHVRYRLADTLRLLGRHPAAESEARRAIALARRRGDEQAECHALLVCGKVFLDRAEPEGARAFLEQALHIHDRLPLAGREETVELLSRLGPPA
ncbi:BTAD domain-containing putative transcriptional regulator [Streptomyces sp. NPDC006512]|uniref:AfsR/SARP family transcriptional regulator n=1 Tax=Streptomyces sp. NPDC006512 TaxID=3154307 RepID=UPI0033AD5F91